MHTKHHTEGIVLSYRNTGEADRYYWILTKDMGLLFAHARSVRKSTSRLAASLQLFNMVRVSVVQGRALWRITNVSLLEQFGSPTPEGLGLLVRLSSLVRRVMGTDEKHEDIYALVHQCSMLIEREELSKVDYAHLECVVVLRLLHILGYMEHAEAFKRFVDIPTEDMTSGMLQEVEAIQGAAIREINKALEATQL